MKKKKPRMLDLTVCGQATVYFEMETQAKSEDDLRARLPDLLQAALSKGKGMVDASVGESEIDSIEADMKNHCAACGKKGKPRGYRPEEQINLHDFEETEGFPFRDGDHICPKCLRHPPRGLLRLIRDIARQVTA